MFTKLDDDVVVQFTYNLPKNSDNIKIDGLVVVYKDKIAIHNGNEKIEELTLNKVKEFRCVSGIGCIFVECMYDGDNYLICRSDMKNQKSYTAIVKRLNIYLEKGIFNKNYEAEFNCNCPKCGLPYSSGSTICATCIDKKSYFKRLWEIAKPYKWNIFLSIILFFAISGLNLLSPYLNRILVDNFIKSTQMVQWQQFLLVILSILVLSIVVNLVSVIRSIALIKTGSEVIVKLRELVFNKVQQLSISKISKRTAGELMNRVTGDTATLQDFITYQLGDIVEQLLMFLSVGTILFIYDWKLALMTLLPIPFVVFSFKLFWKFTNKIYHKQWSIMAKSSTILHDIFSGIRVVKAFGMEKKENEKFDVVNEELCQTSIKNEKIWSILSPILDFFMGAGEFLLLYYVGSKILSNQMTLGEMAQFSAYVGMIYGPLRWVANLPRRLVRVMTSMVKIFEIIDEKVDVVDKENAIDLKVEGYIEFDNVFFGYDDTNDVLKNVNLKIKPGEMIGIVGKSGVGKSTLINLVMRLYDINQGSLKIDGVDIRDISQESLRSQTGVVLQETFLFSGTIYDNIAYAKPSATREEIITAAKIAGAHSFIMKLPDAYNTKVGEKGYTLSGGERQRVSIARALLHNPKILILDEATASLDTETERQIQESLQKLIKDRTTLAIAHRLSTLRNATRLIVIDKGTIAEVGTHEELMKQKGIYYGLVMSQRQMSKMAV